MKKFLIIIFFVLISQLCYFESFAFDQWTTQDKVLELTWATLHVVDWGQTLDIDNKPGCHENNPFMGEHPSKGKINLHMGTWLILHPLITHVLPREVILWDFKIPVRTIFQMVSIGVTGGCVINNFSIGLHVAF